MRKIEVEVTELEVGESFHGIARIFVGEDEESMTEVGSMEIGYNGTSHWSGPAPGQSFQPTTISGADREEAMDIAKSYYDGVLTSGVTSRII